MKSYIEAQRASGVWKKANNEKGDDNSTDHYCIAGAHGMME